MFHKTTADSLCNSSLSVQVDEFYAETVPILTKLPFRKNLFPRFTVSLAQTTGFKPKLPENSNVSQFQKTYFKTDYREKCNFFK